MLLDFYFNIEIHKRNVFASSTSRQASMTARLEASLGSSGGEVVIITIIIVDYY